MSISVVAGQVAALGGRGVAKPRGDESVANRPKEERFYGHIPRCGTTIHGRGAIAFGGVFVGVGVFIFLIATGVIPTEEGSVHAPMWLIGVCAGIFGVPGLMVMWHGVATSIADAAVERRKARYPDQPWCYDYAWSEHGTTFTEFRRLRQHCLFLLVLGGMSVPAHYIALEASSGAWIVWAFTGLIDLVNFFVLIAIVRALVRLARFGRSRLRFHRFPYQRRGRVDVTWIRPRGLSSIAGLKGTLRCIEERYESAGEDGGQRVACHSVWSQSWSDDGLEDGTLSNEVVMTFELSGDVPETMLRERPPRYWELEVVGPSDYSGRFLIPIY